MFIGSSSEARPLVDHFAIAIRRLMPHVDPRPWTRIFEGGKFTLTTLIEETFISEYAVFFITADDKAERRGEAVWITRDNVILEAGMFLSVLPPTNISLAVQAGVEPPSDMKGLVYDPLDRAAYGSDRAMIEGLAETLSQRWHGHREVTKLGFRPPLVQGRRSLASLDGRLGACSAGEISSREPITIESRLCQDTYSEGLKRVQKRFWTTTFLNSDFWQSEGAAVFEANKEMLARLGKIEGLSVRRIFVERKSEKAFLDSEQAYIASCRRHGDEDHIQQRLHHVRSLHDYMSRLIDDKCEVRIAWEGDRAWPVLAAEMQRSPSSQEIEVAIFDDMRVDLYHGATRNGRTGAVDRITCYGRGAVHNFDGYLATAERYIETLWRTGDDALSFLARWEEAINRTRYRIDYKTNWLLKYDRAKGDDAEVKRKEFEAAVSHIRRRFNGVTPRSLLDIGACTGRYALGIPETGLMATDAYIQALDFDSDCKLFIEGKYQDLVASGALARDLTLEVLKEDFLVWARGATEPGKFDLITCMLGTISHFGRHAPPPESPVVQEAVAGMCARVDKGGLLLIGNWSAGAVRDKTFLNIYEKRDAELLALWTPSRAEIFSALDAAGFEYEAKTVHGAIDLIAAWPVND